MKAALFLSGPILWYAGFMYYSIQGAWLLMLDVVGTKWMGWMPWIAVALCWVALFVLARLRTRASRVFLFISALSLAATAASYPGIIFRQQVVVIPVEEPGLSQQQRDLIDMGGAVKAIWLSSGSEGEMIFIRRSDHSNDYKLYIERLVRSEGHTSSDDKTKAQQIGVADMSPSVSFYDAAFGTATGV